jgi:Cu+-exporting ATPase
MPGEITADVYVAVKGRVAGIITIKDTLHPESVKAIVDLKRMGMETALITGDNRTAAEAIAGQVGIEKIFAHVLPEEKAAYIKELQKEGKVVAMVGDGINDAPALAQADVSIAVGSGTDVAMETADITLMKPGIGSVVEAIYLSRRTMRTIRQNLFWAFFYNIICIPLAAAGMLSPIVAAAAMTFSDICVVFNSLRLKRVKL